MGMHKGFPLSPDTVFEQQMRLEIWRGDELRHHQVTHSDVDPGTAIVTQVRNILNGKYGRGVFDIHVNKETVPGLFQGSVVHLRGLAPSRKPTPKRHRCECCGKFK